MEELDEFIKTIKQIDSLYLDKKNVLKKLIIIRKNIRKQKAIT